MTTWQNAVVVVMTNKEEKKMNRVIKIKQTEDRKAYWVSDTHLNHDRDFVYGSRGYKSAQEHKEGVINKINEVVRPNDILFHAGDVCLNTDEKGFEEILASINCKNIYTTWGNHNNPLWKIYQREVKSWFGKNDEGYNGEGGGTPYIGDNNDAPEIYPFRYKNVVFLGNYAEIVVDGQYFVLCHYPIHVWNYVKDGAKMICGHSHYALPFSQVDNLEAKILDVGWDGHGKPLSTPEVLEIMNKKALWASGDHHVK